MLATTYFIVLGIANTCVNIIDPKFDYIFYVGHGVIANPLLVFAYVLVYKRLQAHNAAMLAQYDS